MFVVKGVDPLIRHMYNDFVKPGSGSEPGPQSARRSGALHADVAARIGSRIVRGSIAAGDVLPNEFDLSSEFAVSRTVIREATKVLASKGLLEVRRKTGTRVRPRSEWNLLDAEVLTWMFSGAGLEASLADMMEMRRLIEPAAARIAADGATAAERHAIGAAYTAMEQTAGDLAASVEADLAFHLEILAATHNMFLRAFGALSQVALRASFALTNSNPDLYQQTLPLHRRLADAIQQRNAAQAEEAMLSILTKTSRDIDVQIHARGKRSPARPAKAGRQRS